MERMAEGWTAERLAWLQGQAAAVGLALSGVTSVEGTTEAEYRDAERLEAWIATGKAGEMDYLKRCDPEGRLLRSAVRVAVPWARSVVLCAMTYRGNGPLSLEAADSGAGWIGRYAWSGSRSPTAPPIVSDDSTPLPASVDAGLHATDYHDVLLKKLRQLETELQSAMPCESRCYVDTGPVVERALAARAGLGWIGKNTTVINQQIGSWTLLASIITSLPVQPGGFAIEAVDRCGSCTRCLEACPTGALIAPRQMDARRCIAYLTIEKKGAIDKDLRAGMGRQVFGCDICQDVCPWNLRAPIEADAEMVARAELINPDLEWLAAMTPAEFRRWFKDSPLERTGHKRLRRNVAIAMGNSGEQRFRERLERWSVAEDAVLAEAAQWALERLQARLPTEDSSELGTKEAVC